MNEVKKDNFGIKGQNKSEAQNASFIFIGQKLEKLANALYLLTKAFPEQEPLKWNIRDRALRMVSFTSQLADSSSYVRDHSLSGIADDAVSMRNLVSVARHAGYLSDMHAQVLDAEYATLVSLCRPESSSDWIAGALAVAAPTPIPEFSGSESSAAVSFATPRSVKKELPAASSRAAVPMTSGTPGSTVAGRKAQILSLMTSGVDYSIRDIASKVPDVSEKTIQRELLAMVEQAILVKKGERRWSTYSRP